MYIQHVFTAMEKKFAENNYVQLWTEGNILYLEYKSHLTIDLATAKEILDIISSVCKKEKYLVFQDMSNLKWINKQSRDLFASHPITNQMHAWVHYSKKPLHRIMYTIYLTFSKPEVSMEFFSHFEEGLQWLREFKIKDDQSN